MSEYLKTYKLKFHTLGPVFIGSGDKIGKKDYILNKGEAHVPDLMKMYSGIKKMHLENSFEEFYFDGNKYRNSLAEWMYSNNIQKSDYMPWISYSLSFADVKREEKQRPPHEIMTFIKDAYGMPYVPGSSIKGAIRTALLSGLILKNGKVIKKHADAIQAEADKPKKNDRANKNFLNKEIKEIEKLFFNRLERDTGKDGKNKGNAVNDMLAGIIISDSNPLKLEDLVLCQKVDLDTGKDVNNLPILRECIRPGVDIECTMTIDTSLKKHFSAASIQQAVNDYADFYNKIFRSKFDVYDVDSDQSGIIYLGGGSGYASKTVTYPIFGEEEGVTNTAKIFKHTMKDGDFSKHKHYNDKKWGISPHMCKITNYEDDEYEFGRCKMSIYK